ncbi:hypothetical protein HPB50_011563 [Hyalomma asiaticum]|uniref:Uncharacterized protein n=1 Tax=Hyalomma asiaticum TaxID=266040 RepID=A0ACB7SEN2_HYAAI|nr:hypothetical protein HPB50_011563 [Hyalomma asiaticum]
MWTQQKVVTNVSIEPPSHPSGSDCFVNQHKSSYLAKTASNSKHKAMINGTPASGAFLSNITASEARSPHHSDTCSEDEANASRLSIRQNTN